MKRQRALLKTLARVFVMIKFTANPEMPLVSVNHENPKEPFLTNVDHAVKIGDRDFLIPKGFQFDFASIPGFARWIFPKVGRYAWAAMIHDYLYANRIGTRKEADDLFLRIMLTHNVAKWKAYVMWFAVRVGGKRAWDT